MFIFSVTNLDKPKEINRQLGGYCFLKAIV
jgi:hypothetical protein